MKTNADFIIFAVKQAKEAVAYGFTLNHCNRNLKIALHQYWQNKTLGLSSISQKKKIPRSKAALKKPLNQCRVEHTVPLTVIVNHLMGMKNLNPKAVANVLKKWHSVMLVTYDEDRRLLKSGLRFKMPDNWDKKDILARYKAVGIKVNL
jgi:glucose-6-phosphate isomerase